MNDEVRNEPFFWLADWRILVLIIATGLLVCLSVTLLSNLQNLAETMPLPSVEPTDSNWVPFVPFNPYLP